jgi:hypothetical protein
LEVFALHKQVQHEEWPEQGQRRLRWFSVREAAEAVDEPDLGRIIKNLK